MTDRPILFSAPMIKALLAGTKTQTRRAITPQPPEGFNRMLGYIGIGCTKAVFADDDKGRFEARIRIEKGDRLWVKERIAIVPSSAYRMSEGVQQTIDPSDPDNAAIYRAGWDRSLSIRFRSSLHMPKWASRITLLVDDVKVERLQHISEEDAIAEGVVDMGRRDGEPYSHCHIPGVPSIRVEHDAVPVYSQLWDHINRDGAWAANPWVMAYTFRVILENIDYIGKAAA